MIRSKEISVTAKPVCGFVLPGFEIVADADLQKGCSWALILHLLIFKVIVFESSGVKS